MPVSSFESLVNAPPERVYAWHMRPGALERLTPPWERVDVLSRTGGAGTGARTVVRVGRGPLRFRVESVRTAHEPDVMWRDEQVRGLFRERVHTHNVQPAGAGGTRLTDEVKWDLPLGIGGRVIAGRRVRRDISRALRYQHARLRWDLARHAAVADEGPLRVVVSGASGAIGRELVPFLSTGGHDVQRLVRRDAGQGETYWDPAHGVLPGDALDGADAVVNLNGATIAQRWSQDAKRAIMASRAGPTRLLARRIAEMQHPPRVLVNASAVGYYGHTGDDVAHEDTEAGRDFLAEVGRAWEAATAPAREAGVRVVNLRFGLVLTPRAGALGKLLAPFRAGIGGRIGDGSQWWSWVSMDDAVGAIHHAIFNERVHGPVNVTSPAPVRNARFARTLGRVLGRPAHAALPARVVRALTGEMGASTLLTGQRVAPTALERTGYTFRHADLEGALRDLLGRPLKG